MFEKGDHWLDYKKIFGRFQLITIYQLKGRPFNNAAEKELINDKMKLIMTGKNENAIEKKRQGAVASNQVPARMAKGLRQGKK